MATSRRRERELARRRFERRRAAELERRARAKRRNTVLGAVIGTVAVIVALVFIGLSVFGGSNGKKATLSSKTPSPSASPSTSPSSNADQPAPKTCKKIKPNPPAKGQPTIPDVGKDPTKLVTKDIKVGHGPAAKDGDDMSVYYVGVGCSTGTVFDASYLHKPLQPLPVRNLGQASLIEGFNKGLVGMKAGGVRELVIPGPLAYASQPASAPTFPNDTLIFLVTAKSVTPAKSSK